MTRALARRDARTFLAAAAASGLLLTGCGSGGEGTAGGASSTASSPAASSSAESASAVAVSDPWVVATTEGREDPSMTAAFGVLTNDSTEELTVVAATNTVSERTELHEMAMDGGVMVMRPIEGGISVPAGGSTTLEPGGLHVMIMDLSTPIAPGEDVGVTLTLSDGSTVTFQAQARDFAGANEDYEGEDGSMDMGTGTDQ